MRIALQGYSYCFSEKPYVISRVHNQQITIKSKDSLFEEEKELIMEYKKELMDTTQVPYLQELANFAYKRKHYEEGKALKKELIMMKKFGTLGRIKLMKYAIEGQIKSLFRDVYKDILRNNAPKFLKKN